jgi:transposase
MENAQGAKLKIHLASPGEYGSAGPEPELLECGVMIQLTAQTRILIAQEAVDFRKGIDGLARVCQGRWQADPFSGQVFVFRNR